MRSITFAGLMEKMVAMPAAVEAVALPSIAKAATRVQKTAQEKFGTYQPGYGPFEAWAALATSTVQQKIKAGSAGDDPLIGHYVEKRKSVYPVPLRQSINIEVSGLSAQIGTNDPLGSWQELGTARGIPPRPFLRPALWQNEDAIKEDMKAALGAGLMALFK